MNLLIINFIFCILYALIIRTLPLNNKFRDYLFLCLTFFQLLFVHSYVDINSVPDLNNYEFAFNRLARCKWSEVDYIAIGKMEYGFKLFMKSISFIGGDFRMFLILNSIIIILCYYYIIKLYSPFVIISVLLFLLGTFNQSIFVLRQHLAISLMLVSYPLIIKRQLIPFLGISFISFFIHQTSIVFIPIYFFYKINNKKILLISILLSSVILFIMFKYLLFWFGQEILVGYESYLESDSGTNIVGALILLSFVLYYFIFCKNVIFEQGINKLLFIIGLLGVCILFAGIGFTPTGRLSMYFTIIPILLVPITMQYIKNKIIMIISVAIIILFKIYTTFYGTSFRNLTDFDLAIQL